MKERSTRRRAAVLILVFVLFLGWFAWALYDMQIVHGAETRARSNKKITNSETVKAARGEIRDRNGTLLVSNALQYDVTLSPSRMGNTQEKNGQILGIVALCDQSGLVYADSLPLSLSFPFDDRRDALTETQIARFEAYAEAAKLSSDRPLLPQLRSLYQIDESYSDGEARKIAGVRYELDLRAREITTLEYVFAVDVDTDFIMKVKEAGYFGANIRTTTKRVYHTDSAAHLLGRIGPIDSDQWPTYQEQGYPMDALVGKDGVELAFEPLLRGINGTRLEDLNSAGKTVGESYAILPQPGKHIDLTLDLPLQETVETSLASFIESRSASTGGAAVVMDVKTGGVLSMASYPTFRLSDYQEQYTALSENTGKPLFNRATQGTYAPGSTFKMVTAAGALEEQIIAPGTLITDTGRYQFYPDYQPMCWLYRQSRGTHGSINVSQALEVSCNVFFYDIGRRLTIEGIDKYAHKFGLGLKTGIELPETAGVLAGPEEAAARGGTWQPGSTLAAAIGQSENAFSPLQLCNYVATLAGGGTRYRAHLLHRTVSYNDPENAQPYSPVVEETLGLSGSTLTAIKQGMLSVTQRGSAARYFADFGVSVCAKTGSAQVTGSEESNAVFVCFAPYEDPEVAVALVVEKGGSGYELGASARQILETYFRLKTERGGVF